MAKSLRKAILLHLCISQSYPFVTHVALGIHIVSKSIHDIFYKQNQYVALRGLCTSLEPGKISWGESFRATFFRRFDTALKNHQVEGAWEAYNDFQRVYGIPDLSLVNRLITKLSYSSDSKYLQRACNIVFLVVKEKSHFFQPNLLTTLALSLVRAQMPIPASLILRLVLKKKNLPQMNILGLIILHMVKTETGTHLASNILIEICSYFKNCSSKRSFMNLTKPDALIFNLVLDACVRFGCSFKGQTIIELMSQVGVIADAHSINIIARIYEMNGQRDELNKFKVHVDQVSFPLLPHYQQFYDSLLSLHFKFNDVEAASALILDMYQCQECLSIHKVRGEPEKLCLVPIGSKNLKTGLKLQILPQLLHKDSILQVKNRKELVMYLNGKLVLGNKALAKLILLYKKSGRINELSKLLMCIQKRLGLATEFNLCSDVIDACIELGWLDTAHDILEDMDLGVIPNGGSSYISLLTSYYKVKKFGEAEALLKHTRKVGLNIHIPEEVVTFAHDSNMKERCVLYPKAFPLTAKSDLVKFVAQEMREGEQTLPSVVYLLNSSIYFFMKAKMIKDAIKTYRTMQEKKIYPTMSTFVNLVNGYSSLERYRDITIIWGDIKKNMKNGNLVVCRDLFELLLLNFIRGGYFEMALEVLSYMKDNGMFMDKSLYMTEFLNLHKDIYRSLKAGHARTEAQKKRIEHVQEFRKWVGID